MKSNRNIIIIIVSVLLYFIPTIILKLFSLSIDFEAYEIYNFVRYYIIIALIVGYVTYLKWWKKVGFNKPSVKSFLILIPAFIAGVLPLVNGLQSFRFITFVPFYILETILTTIFMAFIEEVIYRGLIYTALDDYGTVFSIGVSAILYAIIPMSISMFFSFGPNSLIYFVINFLFGIIYAVTRYKYNTIVPTIVVNAVTSILTSFSNTDSSYYQITLIVSLVILLVNVLILLIKINNEASRTV